jgi:hypothetical protein
MNGQRANDQRHSRAVPFHPVLFAVAPILSVYVHNSTKTLVDPAELLLPVVLSLAMTTVVWAALALFMRSAAKAAVAATIFLVFFYLYGHVAIAYGYGSAVHAQTDLLLLWTLLLVGTTWLVSRRLRRTLPSFIIRVTILLNCIAVAVLVAGLPAGIRAFADRHACVEREPVKVSAARREDYPDIYYIMPDAYARADVLASHYNTDISAFTQELVRLGFYIADSARSNYMQTDLSLASSLNCVYLDSLAEAMGPESDDRRPLIDMIQHSRVVDFLRRRGYTIVSFASTYSGMDFADADIHVAPRWSPSEFQIVLANTTILRDALILLGTSQVDWHRNRVLYTLNELPNAGRRRHPVFVWVHLDSPHPPFVFDARGRWPPIPRSIWIRRSRPWLDQSVIDHVDFHLYERYYGPQVTYLNSLLIGVVRRILSQSTRPPVIVIHGDHGPGSVPDWDVLTHTQAREQPNIFYAVYLPPPADPQEPAPELYDSISPVNTFRVILPRYFDTTMTVLPDRSYFSVWQRPYEFYDVSQPELFPCWANRVDRVSDTYRPEQ